eukprot:153510-Lingulodinium_polyedra.AAC.1
MHFGLRRTRRSHLAASKRSLTWRSTYVWRPAPTLIWAPTVAVTLSDVREAWTLTKLAEKTRGL